MRPLKNNRNKQMQSIILIIPYFGSWPVWFPAFLKSCESNPSINWFCPTDCVIPDVYPKNVKFQSISIVDLNTHINNVLGIDVPLTPRKFCDLKPAYGDIFQDHIKIFDFWGFCDMDIIWGNIRTYMSPELLKNYDIISSLENMISGHFTIFKNNDFNLLLYKTEPDIIKIFSDNKHRRYDEVGFTHLVTKLLNDTSINVFWEEVALSKGIKSEVHQEYLLDRWFYSEGAVFDNFDIKRKEYMYLHFINWKRTMRFCEVTFTDKESSFYISNTGMHYQPHTKLQHVLNRFKNVFNGYYAILSRKRFIKRIKKMINV